ncbi:germinal center associated signaling and motility [Homo sapiens]|uniref:Isoform 3 of Germinal center-associated signaling and motility protein n=1 Tax=Homo sapiens TaxID=9606 RepID=Q8N6F7-3|nr:germinal center-associated signaling and motility protein isoform 4 [Homo sapiens]KAI2530838.1 germinal center associated signaling and motility [Homo sapiens]KAI4030906.1 germinal center associated signaling and motility [Homo sapiens]|eukprot:NP_001177189.1 germinal center-associated signaling and motility protein isoform 4 [Homo sapiens]
MGNSLLRENRRQQNTQEMPWNVRMQSPKQRTSRKKILIFEKRQDSQNENERMSSTPIQDNVDQTYSEELCYTLINHRVLCTRPSGNSAEEYYENVPCKAERPRESLGGTETEYSLLHMPSTDPRHARSPEDEYELLMPHRISSHFLQQPRPLMAPSETQFSHL